jgi:hypothetical protein
MSTTSIKVIAVPERWRDRTMGVAVLIEPDVYKTLGSPKFVKVSGVGKERYYIAFTHPEARGGITLDEAQLEDLGVRVGDSVTVSPITDLPEMTKAVLEGPADVVKEWKYQSYIMDGLWFIEPPLAKDQTISMSVPDKGVVRLKVVECIPSPAKVVGWTSIKFVAPGELPYISFTERLPKLVIATEKEVDERFARAKYRVWLKKNVIGDWRALIAEDIKIDGGFLRIVPKLILEGEKWLRPTFDKELILPADVIELIEDPDAIGELKGLEGIILVVGLFVAIPAIWIAMTFLPWRSR